MEETAASEEGKIKIGGTLGFYTEEPFLNKNGITICNRYADTLDTAGKVVRPVQKV